jgi:GNAT superfamily N-acetyltransferase
MKKPVPLSSETLDSAISLIDKVFVYRGDREIARINLIETLEHKNYGQSYWFATGKDGKVIGMTGLYIDRKTIDDSTVWLGWFGVHPEHRRRRIGSSLLEFTINEAKRRGFKNINIYTSTDENETAAHRLYVSFGFRKTDCSVEKEIIYFTKELIENKIAI